MRAENPGDNGGAPQSGAAKVLAAKVAVTDCRPSTLSIGGVDYPALSLNIQMKASTT